MNRKTNTLLEEIRGELGILEEGSKPGDLGATNEPEIDAALSKFVHGLVDALLMEYEITEDDAVMFLTGIAEVLKDEGLLPPLPSPNDPEVIKSEWLGAAQANGFATEVMQAAAEIATD